eukprot:gene4170-5219_t
MSSMFELFDLVTGVANARNQNRIINNNLSDPNNNQSSQNGIEGGEKENIDVAESQEEEDKKSSSHHHSSLSDTSSDSDLVGNEELDVESTVGNQFNRNSVKINKLNLSGGSNSGSQSSNNNSPRHRQITPRSNLDIDSPRAQLQNKLSSQIESSTAHLTVSDQLQNSTDPKDSNGYSNDNGGHSIDIVDQTPGYGYIDGENGGEKEEKLFVKSKSYFRKEYFKETFKYHLQLFWISIIVVIIACIFITFRITFGTRYIFLPSFKDYPTWGKYSSVIAAVGNELIITSFGFTVNFSQFGYKKTKCALPVAILFLIASATYTTISIVYDLKGTVGYLPKYALALTNVIVVSLIIGIKTFKRPGYAFWYSTPFLLMGICLIGYDYLLLKFYLADTTSDISRSIIRILVHPFITAVCLLVARICANQIAIHKPRSVIAFILIVLVFNTYYGRFFGNTMNTLVGVTISSMVLAFVDMIWKCSLRARDSILVKLIMKCSQNASFYLKINYPLYAEFQSHELIYEIASNFVSTFLIITYFFVYNPSNLNLKFQFSVMAIQLVFSIGTELIVTYVSLSVLKLHIIIPFKDRPKNFMFITNFSFLVGLAYSSVRIINILHNKWIV